MFQFRFSTFVFSEPNIEPLFSFRRFFQSLTKPRRFQICRFYFDFSQWKIHVIYLVKNIQECFVKTLYSALSGILVIPVNITYLVLKRSDNPGHNVSELYNILVQFRFTKSKTKLNIKYRKLSIRVASRVAERLKTQDLKGNQKILEKSQIWVSTQPTVQSPFKNLDFANSS